MQRAWKPLAAALLLVTAAGGTVRSGETPAARLDPATEKVCLDFATKIEASVNSGDPKVLDKAFDVNGMLGKALQGIDVSPELMAGIQAGAGDFRLGTLVVSQSIRNGGSYRFLRLRAVDGQPRALFRLLQNSEGGLNYHELMLTVPPKGEPRVSDFYIYVSGERISETMRRALLPAVAEQNKGLLAKLTGQQNEFVSNLPRIQRMQALAQQGKQAEALAIVKALPASLQTDKNILIQRVAIASGVSEAEHLDAMDALRKACPNDACLDVICVDALFIRKKYAEVLQATDRLDTLVGGDPYLEVLRGNVHFAQKKPEKARECIQKALAAEPKMVQAHFSMLGICLEQKDYATMVATLTKLEDDVGLELNDLAEVAEYAELVKSEEYRKWLAGRKKPDPAPAPAPAPGKEDEE